MGVTTSSLLLTVFECRPCFVIDPVLKRLLNRYKGKEEVSPAASQRSIFQQGFKMIYANPVPVASGCQMGVDVVRGAIDIIFKAIEDLINIHDKDISLQFGFACVQMRQKNLKVAFADYLTKEVTDAGFENSMKRMNNSVSAMWRTSTSKMFQSSALGTLIKKPNGAVTEALA